MNAASEPEHLSRALSDLIALRGLAGVRGQGAYTVTDHSRKMDGTRSITENQAKSKANQAPNLTPPAMVPSRIYANGSHR